MIRSMMTGFGGAIVTLLLMESALAIDCMAPDPATAEAIICGDAGLMAEDATLARIFKETVAISPEEDRQALTDNQQVYFTQRTLQCLDAPPPPEQLETVRACVLDDTRKREDYLLGKPAEGPGTGARLVPWVKQGADWSWIWMVHFAAPANQGEMTFNDMVDAVLANVHLGDGPDDYTDYLNMEVTYADARLISANVDGRDLSPKLPHMMSYNLQINVDLRTGKELGWSDAFGDGALDGLVKTCMAQVGDYLALDEVDDGIDVRADDVRLAVGNLRYWQFGATGARIAFYDWDTDLTSDCEFPYAELRPLVKADFPLPE